MDKTSQEIWLHVTELHVHMYLFIYLLGYRKLCLDSENHSPDVTEVWHEHGRDGASQ